MLQTWRWFGPDDPVSLENVAQAGAAGVVSALHHMNQGEVWSEDEVSRRRGEIEAAGLVWPVVESIGVGEEIKTRQRRLPARRSTTTSSRSAMRRAPAPRHSATISWPSPTGPEPNLNWPLANGGTALRFDAVDCAAYDLFILERDRAEADYAPERVAQARARFEAMTPEEIDRLERTLIDWLPARDFAYDRQSFKRALAQYKDVGVEGLRANLFAFVREITEVAEEEGARLAIHPDDPAFPIFGLPRVMSTAEDVRRLFAAVPSPTCGITLCAGSFGSNPNNDLVAMAHEFGPRVHFAHLRNVRREPDGSFFEADHLAGETDMVRLVAALMTRRAAQARGGTRRRRNPDAARPRPSARRRRKKARQPRLFVHRPPQGPGGVARRHADGRGVPGRAGGLTLELIGSRRQRNEFVAIVGRKVELAAAPVALAPLLLGGVDLLPAGRDEIPPDVARPAERRAAEKDEPRALAAGRDG